MGLSLAAACSARRIRVVQLHRARHLPKGCPGLRAAPAAGARRTELNIRHRTVILLNGDNYIAIALYEEAQLAERAHIL